MSCRTRFILHASLVALSLHLAGCAALSNSLDLTHTEKVTTDGYLLVVTQQETFDQWHNIVRSEKARDAGVKVLESGQYYISTFDESDDKITLIALEPYSPELCHQAETAESSGWLHSEFEDNGMTVLGIDLPMVDSCKKGQRSFVGMSSKEGIEIGGAYATLMLEIRHETMLKYKYRWMGTRCRDGWISSSTGRGTCSWHGGIAAPAYRKEYLKDDIKVDGISNEFVHEKR